MTWRLVVTPRVQAALPALPPQTKQYVRQAFREIAQDPTLGKPLRDELAGLSSFRAKRFRIVYQIQSSARTIVVVGVGPRDTLYETLAAELSSER